uniref:Uncharacterized protein n=1 Tax=Physcomitrium patens TaxID=3218 RepID=A0A7I4D326_PHYPA
MDKESEYLQMGYIRVWQELLCLVRCCKPRQAYFGFFF